AGRNELAEGKRGKGAVGLSPFPLFPFSPLPFSASEGSPRYLPRTLCCSTAVMLIASPGHACTHAGASSTARRELHMSHLRTMPRAGRYWGTSYGHFITQYWQP